MRMHQLHSCVAASAIVHPQRHPHIQVIETNTVPIRGADTLERDTEMAHAVTHRSHSFGIADRAAVLIQDLRDRLARRKVYRETINEMSVLSNRELADLGFNRSQLRSIAWEAAYGNK
ncbi:hypothetical protein TM5383_02952 [Thalassovita mediterranea]|uniref:YjiS-like domain-containing protein n=2 Tax=Thalassovita mediterranea TaxID=340021 RepID=A0A0P1GSE0_9RHOB|nr:hypothetical protein TM5383_02952 [Thalassovita mediterranea]SIS29856.1 protein of unknown function [Thalassovita mediterranea]